MEPDIKRLLEPTNERKCCLTPRFESGLRPSKTRGTYHFNDNGKAVAHKSKCIMPQNIMIEYHYFSWLYIIINIINYGLQYH